MPERGGDEAISALGVRRIAIPVPFPQAGGPVNVVMIDEEDGGVALFDTGIGTEEGEVALREAFAAAGRTFADVRRIFVTHGHVDHYGLAEVVRRESGAPVFVHRGDRWKVAGPPPWDERAPLYRAFLEKAGADEASIVRMLRVAAGGDNFALRLPADVGEIRGDERLVFARCEGQIFEAPGHTPGLVVALLTPRGAGPRVLIADDLLLEKVSPNPLLELSDDGERFRALPTYFESLVRVRALEIDWTIPGHGAPFPDHRGVIDSLGAFYERRQEKLLALIPEEGATPVELVYRFFPSASPMNLYLMIGEILGNLDLLEAKGRVRWAEEGGRIRYWRV